MNSDDLNRLCELKDIIEEKELEIKRIKDEYDSLKFQVVEDMKTSGIKSVRNAEGRQIVLKEPMQRISIEEGKHPEAMKWLEDNGYGELMKKTIHHQTMGALIREYIKSGKQFPTDIFKCYQREDVAIY